MKKLILILIGLMFCVTSIIAQTDGTGIGWYSRRYKENVKDSTYFLVSPTFPNTVTLPSPFTLGATSVTTTGAQLNYSNTLTGNIQTQLAEKIDKGIVDSVNSVGTEAIFYNESGDTLNPYIPVADRVSFADALYAQTLEFNILDYGAVSNDGVEDVTAIQAAVDAAAALTDPQGGTVIVPAGKWYIDSPVILKSYMAIKADPNALFYFPNNYAESMYSMDTLDVDNPAFSKLMWCTVDGGYYGNSSSTRTWKFLDLYGTDGDSCFVMFCNFRNIQIENCNVGINLTTTTGTNGWINGNTFKDIVIWRPIVGIQGKDEGTGSAIQSNVFDNIHVQYANGVTTYAVKAFEGDYNLFKMYAYDYAAVKTATCALKGTSNKFEGNLGAVGTNFIDSSNVGIYLRLQDGDINLGSTSEINFNINGAETASIEGATGQLKLNATYGVIYSAGTTANYTPLNTGVITDATGITDAMLSRFMTYNEAAATDISANPQIADPTGASTYGNGIIITIIGLSDTHTLTLEDGNGLQLAGGAACVLGVGDNITLVYIYVLDLWIETGRSDN